MIGVFIKGETLDTNMPTERMACEDKGRDQGDASTVRIYFSCLCHPVLGTFLWQTKQTNTNWDDPKWKVT